MAIIEVVVPQLSESVAEATLLQWHKKVGEAVGRDENLIDVETDKVVLELPAPAAGVIAQIIKADGSTVVAGEVIATIDTEGSSKVSPLQVSAAPEATAAPAAADPVAAAISALASKASAGVGRADDRIETPGRAHYYRACRLQAAQPGREGIERPCRHGPRRRQSGLGHG